MRVFANRNDLGYNDRLSNELKLTCNNRIVNISVAFFSHSDLIKSLLQQGCIVRLIVRLNDGTSYDALQKIYGKDNLQIKYFTRETFHPKLYIIGSHTIYLGSSNCTTKGLSTNTEVNIQIDYEDNPKVFSELSELFEDYWIQAQPLTSTDLNKFEEVMKNKSAEYNSYANKVKDVLGDYGIDNLQKLKEDKITKEKLDQQKLEIFISDMRRSYGNFVEAFKRLENIYTSIPGRKWNNIPIRIEIDRFLWWLGETKYKKTEWRIDTLYTTDKQKTLISELKLEFLNDEKKFDDDSVENYFILNDKFGSIEKIKSLNEDEMFETLYQINAFSTYSQYTGGKIGEKEELFQKNSLKKIQNSIIYLLHSKDNYILRLYECIKGKYKIEPFGEHSVKELYGYVNTEENPSYNGRIQKSLCWLGFGLL